MLQLQLVTTGEEDQARVVPAEAGLLHGTAVPRYLVSPWPGSMRVVVADSYFAGVESALHLKTMGLKFIGVVKTATKQFPVSYLSQLPLKKRRGSVTLVHLYNDNAVDMMEMT